MEPVHGPMVFWVACEECEPGILPIPFDSEGDRGDWLARHRRDTGHEPAIIFDRPADEWD